MNVKSVGTAGAARTIGGGTAKRTFTGHFYPLIFAKISISLIGQCIIFIEFVKYPQRFLAILPIKY